MAQAFNGIYGIFWGICKIPLAIIFVAGLVFIGLLAYNYIIYRLKGKKRKPYELKSTYKKRSVLARLCVDLPKRCVLDYLESDPNDFPRKGIVIFVGEQGNGKTIALSKELLDIQAKHPCCKVITNLAYKYENDSLKHWRQLMTYNNGSRGVAVAIDETQNWFSSTQSKNFPPEMLEVVTQNRKNRRIILGTAQNFYMLAKSIRTQCSEVRFCMTLFGCLTIVKRAKPIMDTDGNVVEMKTLGRYFFVHDEKLRKSYDTYKVIQTLAKSGFVEQEKKQV